MKTTSYEISKKLVEIGFKKTSTIAFFSSKCGGGGRFVISDGFKDGYNLDCYSFDLETILEALPYSIKRNDFEYTLSLNQYVVAYIEDCGGDDLYGSVREAGESLADTAARLLLKLHEKENLGEKVLVTIDNILISTQSRKFINCAALF